ncbi:MAG: type II secretion system minor pseudopilin GspH [Magnetococcales bacterium]|nr:type II secretion system minor pseudopilin GspH [Magnetococcales bacterium]
MSPEPGNPTIVAVSSQQGFTLLELLVVFFIIALLSGLAVVSIRTNDPDSVVTEEARRLRELLSFASRESLLSFRDTGVRFTTNGFSFWRRDEEGRWLPMKGDDLLRERFLPEGYFFSVWVDDLALGLADETKDDTVEAKNEPPKPHLFFFSGGERTPFKVRIQSHSGRWREVTGGLVGAVKVEDKSS